MTLSYFDAFTCLGPRAQKHPAYRWKLDDIRDEMHHCSIAGALVMSHQSIIYDPMWANRRLSEALAPYPNLYPIWNLLPWHTGECPEPEALASLMREQDLRAVMLCPAANLWDLLSAVNAPLLEMLQAERKFTIIRADQFGGFRDLETLLTRYPELPVAIAQAYWTHQRYFTPLLQAYKNLHIMTSHYQAHYGLETLVSLGCEDQLLYSSSAPDMAMGAHRTAVDYADVPEATKAKVAGGNLARLLGVSLPKTIHNPDEDELMHAARLGQPQPTTLVDFHVHVLHEGLQGVGGSCVMRDGDPKGCLPLMERLGYDGGGAMGWIVNADSVGCNDATKAALDVFPASWWGLASFDVSHYSAGEVRRQMAEVYADPRFIGVKPYPVFGMRYDDECYAPMWEFANERGFYALIHRTANDFSEVDALAGRYRNITWVVAHCGESYAVADMAIACMRAHANVYAELTLTPVTGGVVEYFVNAVSADRVLYGSDLPMRDPRQQLGWVVYARLAVEEKKKILGGNALRIIETIRKTAVVTGAEEV